MKLSSEREARVWLETLPEWAAAARERLEALTAMLREENTRQNLVSAASLEQVWLRHIADSAQLLTHVPRESSSPFAHLQMEHRPIFQFAHRQMKHRSDFQICKSANGPINLQIAN